MIFGKRKRSKKNSGNPDWLKWIVSLFVIYVIYLNYTERQASGDTNILGVTPPAASAPTMDKRADFGSYIIPSAIVMKGDITGSGEDARCGQSATVRYSASRSDGTPIDSEQQQQTTIPVGSSTSDAPWGVALAGMQKSGVRQISLPASLRYDSDERKALNLTTDSIIQYNIELLDFSPASNFSHVPFQASDKRTGDSAALTCGSTAHVALTIWGQNGAKLYETSTDSEENAALTLTVGAADHFYGLDRAVLGMRIGGSRTAIIPPSYMNVAQTSPLAEIIDSNAIGIIDVTLLSIVN